MTLGGCRASTKGNRRPGRAMVDTTSWLVQPKSIGRCFIYSISISRPVLPQFFPR